MYCFQNVLRRINAASDPTRYAQPLQHSIAAMHHISSRNECVGAIVNHLAMPNRASLQGRAVLIVQRAWLLASALADAFEQKGAKVVIAKEAKPELANISNLSAAVLDANSVELQRELKAKGIPFVLY